MAKRDPKRDEAMAALQEAIAMATHMRDGLNEWLEHLTTYESREVERRPALTLESLEAHEYGRHELLSSAVVDVLGYMGAATVDEVWVDLLWRGRSDRRSDVVTMLDLLSKPGASSQIFALEDGRYLSPHEVLFSYRTDEDRIEVQHRLRAGVVEAVPQPPALPAAKPRLAIEAAPPIPARQLVEFPHGSAKVAERELRPEVAMRIRPDVCVCGHLPGDHPLGYSYGRVRAMSCTVCGKCVYYEQQGMAVNG